MSDKMLFNSGIIFADLLPVMKGVVSSAYLEKLTSLFTIKGSQIYIINKRGTRIDPCGTPSQPAFTCSKLTIETLEQGVKYVQS